MDYLIFAIGLFLAACGVACLLLRGLMPESAGWKAGATAFLALATAGWLDLLGFALDADPVMEVLVAAALGVSSAMMAKFFLRAPRVSMGLGIALATAVGVAAASCAWFPSLNSYAPILGAFLGAGFGWSLGRATLHVENPDEAWWKWWPTVAGSLIVGTLSWPAMLETVYDTGGNGFALPRLVFLAMPMVALLAGASMAALLWYRLETSGCRASGGARAPGVLGNGKRIAAGFLFLVISGGLMTHWVGSNVEKFRIQHLLDTVKIGASSLNGDILATLPGNRSALQDADYSVLQRKLRDLRASLPGCRFVYTAGLRGKDFIYLVDSEALNSPDYSPPGKVIEDEPGIWVAARDGNSFFGGPRRDARGAWYTALLPVWDSSRNSSSIIGVDYPVRAWLRPVLVQRLAVMWGVLAVAGLLLGYAAHRQWLTGQVALVSGLSGRLSHAMEAAEFDSIEWYPEKNRILLGERLAMKLGFPGNSTGISLRSFWKRVHPRERSLLAYRLRHLAAGAERTDESEVRLLDRNSNPLWVHLHGRLVTDAGEACPHVSAMVLNLHESKRSRQELDRQKMFARQVMDAVPGGVAVLDGDGIIKFVNRAYSRMALMAEAFLVGSPYQKGLEIDPAVGPDKARFEARMIRGDGSTLPVRVLRSPFAESGQETGSILAVTDLSAITDAEHAMLSLRAEANRLALLARKLDDAVIFTDAGGRINWVNEGFTRLTGYSRAEVTGRKPGSFLQRSDVDPEVRKFMRESIAAGQGFETEVLNHTKQGASYLAKIDCHPITDDAGTLAGFMAIQRDITRERTIEAALVERNARVDAIGRSLLALGADGQDNACQFLGLLVELFGAERAVYFALANGQCAEVAAAGPGVAPPGECVHGPVADLLAGAENSLLVSNIASSPYASKGKDSALAGYHSLAGHMVVVDGKRQGAIMVYFGKPGDTPPDFPTCLALIAGLIGREEALRGCSRLDTR